jgi:hypothetical protein
LNAPVGPITPRGASITAINHRNARVVWRPHLLRSLELLLGLDAITLVGRVRMPATDTTPLHPPQQQRRRAIAALFRVINRYVGNLPPMPGVFPDYAAPVVRNAGTEREMVMMR